MASAAETATSPNSPSLQALAASSTAVVMNVASEAINASTAQIPLVPLGIRPISPPTDPSLRDNTPLPQITMSAQNHDRQEPQTTQEQLLQTGLGEGVGGPSGSGPIGAIVGTVDVPPETQETQFGSSLSSPAPEAKSPNNTPVGQICSNCGTTRTPLWRRAPDGQTICNACGLYLKARNTQRPMTLKRPPHGTTLNTTQTGAGATYVAVDVTEGSCPGGGKCNGTGGAEGCNGCPAYNNRVAKSAQLTVGCGGSGAGASSPVPTHPGPVESSPSPSPGAVARSEPVPSANTTVVVACQNCGTTITPLWRRDEFGNTICNACGTSA
ncbi:hypothetical protein L211DRAFT_13981 [Terfezia boudieri ATCC MYA-4762]|uniref:GATA-type domain-containing protein n=1 Tax=Terfezia boudieri ATCC MYA-4762 TaxID=1051890 RepID=A0A3N4M310_9PEZI|nr:hypothetical protein L211DRAFT_13981 [Terfezia boudieri ATCC MYA-4762]